jgi:16S rRNA (guanine527-N7)-methyltransferase
MSTQNFAELITQGWPGLSKTTVDGLNTYRNLVLEASKIQNLTKLVEPEAFFEGHLIDCRELLKTDYLKFPAMDLGSGAGVPGVVCAWVGGGDWVLAESEGRKAEFLQSVVDTLPLKTARVFSGRAEKYLKTQTVESVVCRAVGTVGKILGWIEKCSTWNNLILFKGPGWEKEWEEFQKKDARLAKQIQVASTHEYVVGTENKRRLIVNLVPRRTIS